MNEVVARVGYAYVPDQIMNQVYDPEEALEQGTLFPELDIDAEEYVGSSMPK